MRSYLKKHYPAKLETTRGYSPRRRRNNTLAGAVALALLAGSTLPVVSFAEQPDLVVTGVTTTDVSTDLQNLQVSGNVQVTINNIGSADADSTLITLFEDINLNGFFDDSVDNTLGSLTTATGLAANAEQAVDLPINGKVTFRDSPINAMVDSDQSIGEAKEDNNVNSSASMCEFEPDIGNFEPVLKWEWTKKSVINVPIVAPLEDTNGDGNVNQLDVPSIVFHSDPAGVLYAISGKDGHELWSLSDSTYRTSQAGNIAVADIDNDGFVEIIVPKKGNTKLLAFEHTGEFKWQTSVSGLGDAGGASIADLDGDGHPEIILGNTVLNADGSLRWKGNGFNGNGSGGRGSLSIVADINLDGKPEVIAGAAAYSNTGERLWQNNAAGNGISAVGNFNDDEYPEIAIVARGKVSLLNHTGEIIWGPTSLPGGGFGGAITVADMDGDGIPEIGIAGARKYVVFKADGSILWTAATHDTSSRVTGSSVFDFDGDKQAEVVYGDERYLYVYRGKDGQILSQIAKPSRTVYEYPVIVDIDNDNHADIIVVGTKGIHVYQDKRNNWVNTRNIWNQYNYHVTNINDDGTVPVVEQNSWQVHNTYRLNLQPDSDLSLTAAPDLTASQLQFYPGESANFSVRIGNGGIAPSPETLVSFYNGNPKDGGALIGSITVDSIEPSTYKDVVLEELKDLPEGNMELYAFVDANEQVPECNETNNIVSKTISIGSCRVFGKVVEKFGGPIEGVTIQAGDKTAVTDATGYWEITGLPENNYTLTANKDGYSFDSKYFFVGQQECAVDLQKVRGTSLLSVKVVPDSWEPVKLGDNVTYTITVTNNGSETATDVVLNYTLPEGANIVSIEALDGGSCDADTINCTLPDLTPGATANVKVVVSNTQPGKLVSTVTASSNEYPTEIQKARKEVKPYLLVSISDSPDPVQMQSVLHYTVDVELSHYSPSAATGVKLVTTLPSGVELKSVNTDHGMCDTSTLPTMTCSLTDLSIEGTDTVSHVTVNLDVELKDAGLLLLTAEAEVTANEYPAHTDRQRTKIFIPEDVEVDIAFVIDVTGSMQEEINGVIKALKDFIAQIDPNDAPLVALVVFTDDVKIKAFTRDLDVLLKAVNGLKAKGGGTCPEANAEALLIAIPHTKQSGDILFSTDASPYENTDINSITEQLLKKSIRFNAMITGDCTQPDSWNKLPNN